MDPTSLQLLVLVSVSTPLLKSIWFLHANVAGQDIYLGCWGVCTSGKCTSASLGYSLGKVATANSHDPLDGILWHMC